MSVRWVRGLLAAAVAAVVAGGVAGPAQAHRSECQVRDLTTGAVVTGARAVAEAVGAASTGATLEIRGWCPGSVVLGRDVSLVGVATAAVPVATLVGESGRPTITVARGVHAVVTRIRVTHQPGSDPAASPGLVNRGTATLYASTVAGNAATSGAGVTNQGALTLQRSTVSGNTAVAGGGGVRSTGVLTAVWVTVSGNVGDDGGGLMIAAGRASLTHVTAARNTARWTGGGLLVGADATVTASATALGHNLAGASGPDCAGPVVSRGWLAVGDADGGWCEVTTAVGDQIDAPVGILDVQVGELAWNGGPTQTMLPLPGSPLVDAIPTGALATDGTRLCPGLDQRRVIAPRGAGCDIGAAEA